MESVSRKEKRKALKKEKRKQIRKELAEKARAEEEARLNDPEELRKIEIEEQKEKERLDKQRKDFEERETIFRQTKKKEEEQLRNAAAEIESKRKQVHIDWMFISFMSFNLKCYYIDIPTIYYYIELGIKCQNTCCNWHLFMFLVYNYNHRLTSIQNYG